MAVLVDLDALQTDVGVVSGLRRASSLAANAAGLSGVGELFTRLRTSVDSDDTIVAIAAVHAVGGLVGGGADVTLADLLDDERAFVAEHAMWVLSARCPYPPAIARLANVVATGNDFAAMLAQRTLAGWAVTAPALVADAFSERLDPAGGRLVDLTDIRARRRLVESLGLVDLPEIGPRLARLAGDDREDLPVRTAAVAALGDRADTDVGVFEPWCRGTDEFALHARLARADHLRRRRPWTGRRGATRVGQVFVHARFVDDPSVDGRHGGIPTLLRLLAAAFTERGDVDVVSIGGGSVAEAVAGVTSSGDDGRSFAAAIPFGDAPARHDAQTSWAYRVEIERGLRRVVAACPLDLLHLRMADVGTLAAARVARTAGIPIVFTAAPDPHGVLAAMEADGRLTRAGFGESDASDHWWFRARMVERLTAQASRLVALPRPHLARDFRAWLGVDVASAALTVVPEGIDQATHHQARRLVDSRPRHLIGTAVDDLLAALDRLPGERRELPLMITVGRMHPVKGMDRVARVWRDHFVEHGNLVIVGGDLLSPSPVERAVLDHLARLSAPGLIQLGARSRLDVACLLEVAAGRSLPALPCGIYVAGSSKEEFGLAIVEAMAAGLPVVAPATGGPATYIRDGVDGVLVGERSDDCLAAAMAAALALADVPGRAKRTSQRVLADLSIERMAERLTEVYVDLLAPATAA